MSNSGNFMYLMLTLNLHLMQESMPCVMQNSQLEVFYAKSIYYLSNRQKFFSI